MVGDPNWLYSTICPVIGSNRSHYRRLHYFRILALLAEKRSLKNQLDDKKVQLKGLNKPLTLVRKDKLTEEERQRRIELFESDQKKIVSLKAEISNLESRLKAFAYPPNLGWGLVVLGCFAFAGIVLPIMVIMIEIYSTQVKQFIFILFFWGLAAILTYIAFQLRELRRQPNAAGEDWSYWRDGAV